MALSSLNHPIESDVPSQVLIDFPDNRLMIDLCGEFDRNLAEIENKLSVQLIRRGNQVAVIGAEESRQKAVSVLQRLYQRLEVGRAVELEDVDRELRMDPVSKNSEAM
ncbi:MAG: phosphate starvation-inducible protein PhoH, partial [Paracoccaceae bacterium]